MIIWVGLNRPVSVGENSHCYQLHFPFISPDETLNTSVHILLARTVSYDNTSLQGRLETGVHENLT